LCGIAEDDVVLKDAIVGYVTVRHDEAVGADDGFSFGGCAAIDGCTFADGGVVAYFGRGYFSLEFEVLRNACDYCSGEYGAVAADSGAVHDDGVGMDMAVVAYCYVLLDYGEGFDSYVVTDDGIWMYYC
jgi:hypothetical protein